MDPVGREQDRRGPQLHASPQDFGNSTFDASRQVARSQWEGLQDLPKYWSGRRVSQEYHGSIPKLIACSVNEYLHHIYQLLKIAFLRLLHREGQFEPCAICRGWSLSRKRAG